MSRSVTFFSLAALVALSLFFPACTDDKGATETARRRPSQSPAQKTSSSASPVDSATPSDDGGPVLLYMDGRTLHRFDVEAGDEKLDKLPSPDVAATLDGARLAYVVGAVEAPDDEDFIASPEIRIYEVESGNDVTIGGGLSPFWHPDGTRLAYLEPNAARVCEGESCSGSSNVVIADLETEERKTVVADGRWSLVGWWGERLLVVDQEGEPATVAVSEDGETETLPVAPSEVWGAAPDGGPVVRSVGDRVEFLSPDRFEVLATVDLDGRLLGRGTWSPTSEELSAALLDRGRFTSQLVLIDLNTQDPVSLDASRGATGEVVWAVDGDAYVYVRSTGPQGLMLEAVYCARASSNVCDPLFSWRRGVKLLSLN